VIGRGAWLRLWYVWLPAAVVVAVNLFWLAGMRRTVIGRGSLLAQQVEDARKAVATLEAQAQRLERTRKALAGLQDNLSALRREEMAPMKERLVPFLTDVVKRTQEAGLAAEKVAYSARREEKSGLVYFSANYSIKGSYEQIRRCAYLLESSPQFILLDGLAIRGDENASSLELQVALGVGTYFSDIDEALMKQLGVSEVTDGG